VIKTNTAKSVGERPKLSPRQEECLRGVFELKTAKQIARDLGISPDAVEKHLKATREKLGVTSSAEAARLFFLRDHGPETPHYGSSDLEPDNACGHQGSVPERSVSSAFGQLEDSNGALLLDQPFSPRQTLLTIAAVSLASIVGLLLLVACAEAVKRLMSG
jgi:DNA-binding CsgD family transcriptional regulator